MTIEISILIAVIGCFVGIGGWFKGRDTKIAADAEWKGNVNAKLDVIVGIKENVEEIEKKFNDLTIRVKGVEESAKQAHLRINELGGRNER